jgi:hypothetical protein
MEKKLFQVMTVAVIAIVVGFAGCSKSKSSTTTTTVYVPPVAPTFVSAQVVAASQLVVNVLFSEDIAVGVAAGTGFTVGGTTGTITGIAVDAVDASQLNITLSKPVKPSETVTLAFSGTTSVVLDSTSTESLAAFTAQPVDSSTCLPTLSLMVINVPAALNGVSVNVITDDATGTWINSSNIAPGSGTFATGVDFYYYIPQVAFSLDTKFGGWGQPAPYSSGDICVQIDVCSPDGSQWGAHQTALACVGSTNSDAWFPVVTGDVIDATTNPTGTGMLNVSQTMTIDCTAGSASTATVQGSPQVADVFGCPDETSMVVTAD